MSGICFGLHFVQHRLNETEGKDNDTVQLDEKSLELH